MATNPVLVRLIEERQQQLEIAERLTQTAQSEQRDLVDAELDLIRRAAQRVDELDAQIKPLQEIEERKQTAAGLLSTLAAGQQPVPAQPGPSITVNREERTYRPDSQHSIFRDMWAAPRGDQDAQARLARHTREAEVEMRASSSANFAGLVVPQYLTDLVAPIARAGRPFANIWRSNRLPAGGLAFNISRITTGSSIATQANEGDEVATADVDDTLLTVNVQTIAGEVTVSRQAIERGTLVEDVLMQDLAANYATQLDATLVNHVRTLSGVNSVTYTDASPTVGELWPKLADAAQQIAANRFLGATHVVLHPRRWGWVSAAVDTAGRPLIPPSAPSNPMGDGSIGAYGPVGSLMGLTAITDGNIPTNLGAGNNEDLILVVRADDLLLWEDSVTPRFLRFEEVTGANNRATLQVKVVAYNYVAFTAARYPSAVSRISGTGLVAPAF